MPARRERGKRKREEKESTQSRKGGKRATLKEQGVGERDTHTNRHIVWMPHTPPPPSYFKPITPLISQAMNSQEESALGCCTAELAKHTVLSTAASNSPEGKKHALLPYQLLSGCIAEAGSITDGPTRVCTCNPFPFFLLFLDKT